MAFVLADNSERGTNAASQVSSGRKLETNSGTVVLKVAQELKIDQPFMPHYIDQATIPRRPEESHVDWRYKSIY
jgi:hypothetical protein